MAKRTLSIQLEITEEEASLICEALRQLKPREVFNYNVVDAAALALAKEIEGDIVVATGNSVKTGKLDILSLLESGYTLSQAVARFLCYYDDESVNTQAHPENVYWHPTQPRGYSEEDLDKLITGLRTSLNTYTGVIDGLRRQR
ncbi:MAG: hypothetical protein KDH96_08815 [Candidatus Riesia sp.]|nr:hypothetical protein [Candidatus Riesia sp.]